VPRKDQATSDSHCGSKQQESSPDEITLLLLVRATYISVLFFAHIPFVVNRAFSATPGERLQQSFAINSKKHWRLSGLWYWIKHFTAVHSSCWIKRENVTYM